jgi:hypothetical protein
VASRSMVGAGRRRSGCPEGGVSSAMLFPLSDSLGDPLDDSPDQAVILAKKKTATRWQSGDSRREELAVHSRETRESSPCQIQRP